MDRRRPVADVTLRKLLILSALTAILTVALVSAGVWQAARADAWRTAERVWDQIAGTVLASLSTHDYGKVGEATRDELLAEMAPYLDTGIVFRVKVWSVHDDGIQIVFSNEPQVEGERKPLNPGLTSRLAADEVRVVPVPDDAEHRFEIAEAGRLLEVFTGFTDAGGNESFLEVYVPTAVAEATRDAVAVVVPLALVGLLALALVLVPITVDFARRIDRNRFEHQAALHYGLAAADLARREIAGKLHDNVLPELASAGLLLDAAHTGSADPTAGDLVGRARDIITSDIDQIRGLLTELASPLPLADNLAAMFTDLVARLVGPGHRIEVDVDPDLDLGPDAALLLHRTAAELLRNAVRHGRCTRVSVRIAADRSTPGQRPDAVLTVADDGVGFDPARPPRKGHIGLLLVRRVTEDVGGQLTVVSAPASGTTVAVQVPAHLRMPVPRYAPDHDGPPDPRRSRPVRERREDPNGCGAPPARIAGGERAGSTEANPQ